MNHGNQASGSYINPAPAPMHPIPSAIESLSHSINGLAATADMIANRLGRVTLPAVPSKADHAGQGLAAITSRSPMADEIEGQRQRIESIVAGLQDVLDRLEV